MATSMGEQAEEGASGALVVGVAWLAVSSTSWAEAARPEPSSVQVAVSAVGWTEGGAPEASFAGVAIGQASVFASPAPSIARGAALEELPLRERSVPLEVGTGTSRSLV